MYTKSVCLTSMGRNIRGTAITILVSRIHQASVNKDQARVYTHHVHTSSIKHSNSVTDGQIERHNNISFIIYKLQLIFRKKLFSIYNALTLPYINYCLHSWGSGSAEKKNNQKRAIRAISCAGYNTHTEPLFKIYKLLKIDDIYNCRLLVLYYNLLHNKVLQYLSPFLSNTSLATNRYPIRHPRLQPSSYSQAFSS